MKRESLQSLLARIEYRIIVTKVYMKMLTNYNGETFFSPGRAEKWETAAGVELPFPTEEDRMKRSYCLLLHLK